MTREEFEQVYEQAREKAVATLKGMGFGFAVAEDAVQEAALYFLERLTTYRRVTPSLFIQLAVMRAKDAVKPSMGRNKFEIAVGTSDDLAEHENTGSSNDLGMLRPRGGRNLPHSNAD